jgi:hypothetical protein
VLGTRVTGKRGDADGFERFFSAERDRLVAQAYLLVGDVHAA